MGGGLTPDLFSAYELEGGQQLAGALVPETNREPGQTGGGGQGGLAHTAAHELVCTLHVSKHTLYPRTKERLTFPLFEFDTSLQKHVKHAGKEKDLKHSRMCRRRKAPPPRWAESPS